MWVLKFCIGLTWMGCGTASDHLFPTKEECFEVLAKVRVEVPAGTKGIVIACVPKKD